MGLLRAVVVLVCVLAAQALAQSPQATKLFEEGRELAKQEKWAEACDKFQQSLELDPAPGTKLNLGDCFEKQGQVRKGWLMFEEAARDFERTNDPRAKFAHDRARDAEAKLATLVLEVADASHVGLAIRIGDRAAVPQAKIVERVDPGTITIVASAPDAAPFETQVTAVAGKTTTVDVPALAPVARPTEPQPAESPPDRRHKRIVIAFVLGGAGVVGLAASGLLGLSAKSDYDAVFDDGECDDSTGENICTPAGKARLDDAGSKADLATGVAVAGAALVAVGVIVYVTAPREALRVTPTATTSSVGLAVGGSF